jgi:hypothetical protein
MTTHRIELHDAADFAAVSETLEERGKVLVWDEDGKTWRAVPAALSKDTSEEK